MSPSSDAGREGEDPGDPRAADKQRDGAVVGAEGTQFAFDAGDLPVELVDQRQAGLGC